MIILGIATPFSHDPSAALLIDGKIAALCDEERLIREKHAMEKLPVNAIKYCLDKAGITPNDIDIVAYPWSYKAYQEKKWDFFKRTWKTRPAHAYKTISRASSRKKGKLDKLDRTLAAAGIDRAGVKREFVEHHIAHASSAYHLSGFKDAAILSVDGAGEFTSTLFAEGIGGKIRKIKEIIYPDSLGLFYSTMTEYLGFEINDGEYKVMGMAPYGDPSKVDFSKIIKYDQSTYRIDDLYVCARKSKRYLPNKMFSKQMVADWGPPRSGDGLAKPYIDIAAKTQKTLEDVTITLMEKYLGDTLKNNGGKLCFAGGCALNVKLNKRIIEDPLVNELFVQPAAHDSGTSLGAATYAAYLAGENIEPMKHAYYGPSYSNPEIKKVLDRFRIKHEECTDIADRAATLLAEGNIVAWFQGAMEFGPRALGNRSILGNPAVKGTADEINARIKFREKWRPFCPSILPEYADKIFTIKHPSPYMTFSFEVRDEWILKVPEVVHVDKSARPQIVDKDTNPLFYNLIDTFHKKTGVPIVINTSLNRRGEPIVCSPEDAIHMFYNCGLEYMAIGDFLIKK
ncbi:MAG: carbamoyltransferase [Candidatus Omnitrophica bacterium]|nr:carbamoyltransferase [Candidatus Omnitrophota bacterium]